MTVKKEYELRNVHEWGAGESRYLTGHIYGDEERFEDGKFIQTSRIVDTLQVADGVRYETNNSYYLVKDM